MKKLSLLFLAVVFSAVVFAQIEDNQAVPINPKVLYGTLDNGMTYYIQENAKPIDRAEFYLVVDAGAICEDPDQNGLAHFCEHMAFNGTEHFAKHDIIQYLQSIGMKFGPEINAFTSHDVTAYMLQKVPTNSESTVDSALLVLYDWASAVSYEDEEIDSERGVIHEEWRTGNGADKRMSKNYQKKLFQGSKYAKHDVIGDINIVDNFEYDVIRRFFNDWYRPDLQAVIAIGDFDKEEMLKKIKDLYGQIPKRENPRERIEEYIPEHKETLVALETDPEAQYSMVQLYYKHKAEKQKDKNYYRQGIVEALYNQMLNARLGELLLSENPPFIYSYSAYTSYLRTMDAYIGFAVCKNGGQMDALDVLLTENKRVSEYGFLSTELERAKKEYMANLEQSYKDRDNQESGTLVWNYFSHFLENEPAPGVSYEYEFVKKALPEISLDEINLLADEWITDENRVVVMTGPEQYKAEMPTEAQVLALVAEMENKKVTPYIDNVSDKPLVENLPTKGKIIAEEKNEKLGTTTLTFENGVKVVLKSTDFKDDEILMTAYSMGGISLYPEKYIPSANFCTQVVTSSGIGSIDQISLDKKLAGKVASIYPYLGNVSEGFSGSCTPKDLETLLKLNYLYLTAPRVDGAAFSSAIKRTKAIIADKANNPGSVFQDSVSVVMADYSPRVKPLSVELIDEAKKNQIDFIFKERFGDPSSFTYYFVGNINIEETKSLMETWIGGLPNVEHNETFADNNVRPPKGKVRKTVTRDMEVPKATVYISFSGEFDYNNPDDRLLLSTLSDILSVRYVETVREEEGGSYGVGVWPSMSAYPYSNYKMNMRFDCDPESVDKLIGVIYREIDILKKDGPAAKDINGVIENKLKTFEENQEKNRYWLNTLKNIDYYNRSADERDSYVERVKNLDAKKLKKAAKRYFGKNVVEMVLMPSSMENNVKNPVSNDN